MGKRIFNLIAISAILAIPVFLFAQNVQQFLSPWIITPVISGGFTFGSATGGYGDASVNVLTDFAKSICISTTPSPTCSQQTTFLKVGTLRASDAITLGTTNQPINSTQFATAAGCSVTAGTIGTTCTSSTFTLPVAMANTTYHVSGCVPFSTAGPTTITGISIINTTQFTVLQTVLSTLATGGGNINCIVTP